MKMTWKKKSGSKRLAIPNLPFENDEEDDQLKQANSPPSSLNPQIPNKTLDSSLAGAFHEQGNKLAEDGKYREALGKWEAAITLMPEKAVLHEQKAQVLLEVGDSWGALKAATRATELDPSWAEAWTTLGRAQLNFGEPDSAIETFDNALALKPELAEAQEDRQTALQLVKKRKHLHSSGLSTDKSRYAVGDGGEAKLPGSA
ncbi:tetratricopeptide repeat protein 33-like [Chenopodium quinoa]|uniref:tetratricopeptide repeat protein 33-like n=1 Tax=Chenopodium quinoa TaxID=63459 RepID=UPI000B792692|nr:tetratricopeptide repeat protein 33-like [Chenopodium quinoa]